MSTPSFRSITPLSIPVKDAYGTAHHGLTSGGLALDVPIPSSGSSGSQGRRSGPNEEKIGIFDNAGNESLPEAEECSQSLKYSLNGRSVAGSMNSSDAKLLQNGFTLN